MKSTVRGQSEAERLRTSVGTGGRSGSPVAPRSGGSFVKPTLGNAGPKTQVPGKVTRFKQR